MSQFPPLLHTRPSAALLRGTVIWIGAASALMILPLVFDSVLAISILNQMGIAIVFALSYNMLLGQGGMLSFGHAVYFGLGGFLAVHGLNFIEAGIVALSLPWVPLVGGICGLLFAVIIGSFSTRRAGTVFAMISLGIGEMIAACSLIFVAFFGGEEGVSGDRTFAPKVFGHDFAHDVEIYYLIAIWVFVSTVSMYLFSRTPAGRMANAVRDNPERAEFIGYSQRWVRFISFCAAGFFAGVSGGLFAVNYEIVTEENLNLATSGSALLMVYIGGVGCFFGPIVGAVLLTLLQTVLSNYTEIWQLYVGIVFLATVMYLPSGLTGILTMHTPAYRGGNLHRLVIPYLRCALPGGALVIGIIGLLEMLHHTRTAGVGEHLMPLFFLTVDTTSASSWLVMLVCALGGALALRQTVPMLRAAWSSANQLESGQ